MKLLLYCTKAKPYLMKYKDGKYKEIASLYNKQDLATCDLLNGKIVAECDFEVEKIEVGEGGNKLVTKTLSEHNLLMKSCLDLKDILKYTENIDGFGYAIHIKNLHIFDEPKYLDELWAFDKQGLPCKIERAPQNMRKCHIIRPLKAQDYVLISIKPEWLCKILNGEKTIEVRKKVLKEMLK
jgi:predicted transcriptional regulator